MLTNDLLDMHPREKHVCVLQMNLCFLADCGFVSHSTQTGGPDNSNYAATALDPSGEDDVELLHLTGNILKNLK